MRHKVRIEEPHVGSMAAGVLLKRKLQDMELDHWFNFRRDVFKKVREKHGRLWCHYCGKDNLLEDVTEGMGKEEMKKLATLDHIVPRSQGGAEYDEDNVVVACYSCNQRKADMNWVPFWFEGNMWFGMVESPKEWAEVLDAYVKVNYNLADLMGAKECTGSENSKKVPKFGFAIECRGDRTLGKFFEENGMPGVVMVKEEKKMGV